MSSKFKAKNNSELIDLLRQEGILENERVIQTMKKVDRKHFVPVKESVFAYADYPQKIGFNVVISAPHMHAHVLEQLANNLKDGCKALDVGSGSGYLTACMALMVGPTGQAIGIDHIDQLVSESIRNSCKDQQLATMIKKGNLKLVAGDGYLGYPEGGPYDAIHVGASAPSVPKIFIDQLKIGGRLVMPIGMQQHGQDLTVVEKLPNGHLKESLVMRCIFVPLTTKDKQINKNQKPYEFDNRLEFLNNTIPK